MRQSRSLFVSLAVTTAVIAAAACSSGSKGSKLVGHGDMASGTYQISNFTVVKDGCNFGLDPTTVNGASFPITVSNGTLSFPLSNGDATGPYSAGVFDASNSTDIDASTFPTPYDCVITVGYDFKGATSAVNEADATEKQTLKKKSGTQCTQLLADPQEGLPGTSLPCTSTDTQHVKLLPTVTATLVSSTGYGTNLSNDYNSDDTASTLTANLTANGQSFTLADNFQCYSSTATGVTFELGTYTINGAGTFLVDIQPSSWMVGDVAFGGTSATLNVDLKDAGGDEFIGSATGGSVHLPAAPTTTSGACSMGMANVPLTGTFYPATPFAPHHAPVTVKTPAGKRFNWFAPKYH